MIKFCKNCFEFPKSNYIGHNGYMPFISDVAHECPLCKHKLEDLDISIEDYVNIVKISEDKNFIQAMIKLKQNDIIEYQARMSQFKTQIQEREAIEAQQRESKKPHCPTCGSSDIVKLSGWAQDGDLVFFGGVRRFFCCNNCGYEW